jgi:hypothetical protein
MRKWPRKLWQQTARVLRTTRAPGWHQPGTYSVWAYDAPDFNGPILVLGLEWAIGDLRGVRACGAWLHEDDTSSVDDDEFTSIRGDFDNQDTLARLIATGRLIRIGPIPASDRYYTGTEHHPAASTE